MARSAKDLLPPPLSVQYLPPSGGWSRHCTALLSPLSLLLVALVAQTRSGVSRQARCRSSGRSGAVRCGVVRLGEGRKRTPDPLLSFDAGPGDLEQAGHETHTRRRRGEERESERESASRPFFYLLLLLLFFDFSFLLSFPFFPPPSFPFDDGTEAILSLPFAPSSTHFLSFFFKAATTWGPCRVKSS